MDTIEAAHFCCFIGCHLHLWRNIGQRLKTGNCCLGCDLCRHQRTNLKLEREHKIAKIKFLLGIQDH